VRILHWVDQLPTRDSECSVSHCRYPVEGEASYARKTGGFRPGGHPHDHKARLTTWRREQSGGARHIGGATWLRVSANLIFEALCQRYRATTNVSKTIRRELQETTGLVPEALMDALKVLCGPEYDYPLRVRFVDGDGERITLGQTWLSRCDGKGLNA
jgi:hypothetical protein